MALRRGQTAVAVLAAACLGLSEAFLPPSAVPSRLHVRAPAVSTRLQHGMRRGHCRGRALVHTPAVAFELRAADVSIEAVAPADINGFKDTAVFFVTAFWDDYKAETTLKGDVLKRVGSEQFVDMRNRYGQLRPLPATMLVAKNGDGEIVGCAGVEVALLNGNKIMPKTRSNLDQGYDLEALLANVAVAPAYRGMGIARKLCTAGEEEVHSWGYDELLLLVEADNAPAVSLYKKMGFKEAFRDEEAKASQAVAYSAGTSALKTITVCTVAMRKSVKVGQQVGGGMFGLGRLFGR